MLSFHLALSIHPVLGSCIFFRSGKNLFTYVVNNCIRLIFWLFFENKHDWKLHHWNPKEPRTRWYVLLCNKRENAFLSRLLIRGIGIWSVSWVINGWRHPFMFPLFWFWRKQRLWMPKDHRQHPVTEPEPVSSPIDYPAYWLGARDWKFQRFTNSNF